MDTRSSWLKSAVLCSRPSIGPSASRPAQAQASSPATHRGDLRGAVGGHRRRGLAAGLPVRAGGLAWPAPAREACFRGPGHGGGWYHAWPTCDVWHSPHGPGKRIEDRLQSTGSMIQHAGRQLPPEAPLAPHRVIWHGCLVDEMPTYELRGVAVDFPHQAYDCQARPAQPLSLAASTAGADDRGAQLKYMEHVIQALQEVAVPELPPRRAATQARCTLTRLPLQSKSALLESPTGTGKTLCLLCASLAWREAQGLKARARLLWLAPGASPPWSSGSCAAPVQAPPPALQAPGKPDAEAAPAPAAAGWASGFQALLAEGSASAPGGARPPESAPPIIYTSRTHSQLAQVISELKRTSYRHEPFPRRSAPARGRQATRGWAQASHDGPWLPAADVHAPHGVQSACCRLRPRLQGCDRRRRMQLVRPAQGQGAASFWACAPAA